MTAELWAVIFPGLGKRLHSKDAFKLSALCGAGATVAVEGDATGARPARQEEVLAAMKPNENCGRKVVQEQLGRL